MTEKEQEVFDALRNGAFAIETRLAEMADTLDRWSEGSRSGGWSTHLCGPMEGQADSLRRDASRLRAVIKKADALKEGKA